MDKQFDELSKSLAEGASRRVALRKFGVGLAGAMLATAGLDGAAAAKTRTRCYECHFYYGPESVCSTAKPSHTCYPVDCVYRGGC